MITIEVSERVYKYIQQNAVPFEDTADSVLIRLLGLDTPATSTKPGKGGKGAGALSSLIHADLLAEGDELRWHRAKKNVSYSAEVGPNGTIRLADGKLVDTPSGAAVAVAGGNHPGWDVWTHVLTGRTLAQLRSQVESNGPEPDADEDDWQSRLREVMSRLPAQSWTSYGDLGRLLGRHPRELGNHLGSIYVPNAHRVLQHNGKVSPGFRWVGKDRGDVYELLRQEGVLPASGRVALPEQRLYSEDLRQILEE